MDNPRIDEAAKRLGSEATRRGAFGLLAGMVSAVRFLLETAAASNGEDTDEQDPSAASCKRLNQRCGNGTKCCRGFVCRGGRCRCKSGSKPCRGRCIAKDACCTPDDCNGRACTNGQCQPCVPGFKLCLLTCIREDECCLCSGGSVCQGGACVCPGTTTDCGNGTCKAAGADGCCGDGECRGGKRCIGGRCRCESFKVEINGRCIQRCDFAGDCPGDCSCSTTLTGGQKFCSGSELTVCDNAPCQNDGQCGVDELCVASGALNCGGRCRRTCPQ